MAAASAPTGAASTPATDRPAPPAAGRGNSHTHSNISLRSQRSDRDRDAITALADPKNEEHQMELLTDSGYGKGDGALSHDDAEFFASFSEERRKKLYRKVDWRLVPMLALLYLFSCE